ncbi:MAG: EAL domain-containing protein [Rhodocyclaceae bacterium]|nr:EAL domain-containing protein [Rhodocyclaceae bacterium]
MPSWLWQGLFIVLAYPLLGLLSRELALPGYATAVWPSAGISLGALLLWGGNRAFAVWLGALLLNLRVAVEFGAPLDDPTPWLNAASIGFGATLHALVGAHLCRKAFHRDPELRQARTSLRIIVLGGPVACLLSAAWGVSTLLATGLVGIADAPFSFLTWLVGDILGVLLFTPLFLVLSQGGSPAWSRRRLTVAVPLLLASAAVVAVFLVAAQQEQQRIADGFDRQVAELAQALETQFRRNEDAVAATRSFIAGQERVTRAQFATFVSPLLERLPGLHALSWNPLVRAAERERFESRARALGHPGYRILTWDTVRHWTPAVRSEDHLAVLHIEPLGRNAAALGIDLLSHPKRRATVETLRRTGRATVSDGFRLVQETGDQPGVLLMLPVFDDPAATEIAGVTVGVFRLGDLIARALQGERLRFAVGALESRAAEAPPRPLLSFRLHGDGSHDLLPLGTAGPGLGQPRAEHCMRVADRQWCLRLEAEDGYIASQRSWSAWAILSSGILFCGLLGLTLLISSGRAIADATRAEELARINGALQREARQREEAESALIEEKERAEVTLHSIGEGVVTTDVAGHIRYLNPVAERILGWRSDDAAGRPAAEVIVLVHEDTREPLGDPLTACLARRETIHLEADTLLIARDGRSYAIQDSASPIIGPADVLIGAVMVFNDVTDHRRLSREALYLATHDALTGLVNRREFESRLERAFDTQRHSGGETVLCFIDLDRFKAVNDSAGHRAGDELLRQITRMLSRHVRERDTLARIGGDEFALVLANCPLVKALEICRTMVAAVAGLQFTWEAQTYTVGASIGVVPLENQRSVEQWVAQADAACYTAKDRGRGRVHVFEGEALEPGGESGREVLRTADIREAISDGRLCLHAQPVVDLAAGRRVRMQELLVRLRNRSGQLLLPASFLPAAERYRLMGGIDHWVIRHGLAQRASLQAGDPGVRISINLSAAALGDQHLPDELLRLISEEALAPDCLSLEVAEAIAVRNLSAVTELFRRLAPAGVAFTLDDFAGGPSALGSLGDLPIRHLKITGGVCNRVHEDRAARAIVTAAVALCRGLDIQPIAARVEEAAAIDCLRELGITWFQGRAIAGPGPIDSRLIAS